MKALVLEPDRQLRLRDIEIEERLGPRDVRVAIRNVGICGSDIHYREHGRIGPFVVDAPMVLGHEASGIVTETGAGVDHLHVGDKVCMEPGIPDLRSRASRLGMYNLDPSVRFWATPPIHGCLRPSVVHPSDFTYRLPDSVSLAEGAMVEPLAVGMHAVNKAKVTAGDVAVVVGAGTIGMVTILAALAGGCSRVIAADIRESRLDLAASLGPVTTIRADRENLAEVVNERTDGWGADVVFEASGSEAAAATVFDVLCPGGAVVFIGMPGRPIAYDVVAAQVKEARVEHVFRYANVYPRALALMASGRIDVKTLLTERFPFGEGVQAFDFAAKQPDGSVKVQIEITD